VRGVLQPRDGPDGHGRSPRFMPLNDPKAGNGPGQGTVPDAIAENGSAVAGMYWDSAGNTHTFILDLDQH